VSELSGQSIGRAHIEGLLACSLGDEKARSVWDDALRRLGVPPIDSYSRGQAKALLDSLAGDDGIIGLAARFARVRLDLEDSATSQPPRRASSGRLAAVRAPELISERQGRGPASGPGAPDPRVDLLDLLIPALGEEKAKEALAHHAKRLGFEPDPLSRGQAIAILDAMLTTPGLIGVVANFAKVAFLLRYPA
jgi:hypothetical protein